MYIKHWQIIKFPSFKQFWKEKKKHLVNTHANVWVLESEKIGAGGRTTFGTGSAIPFVVLPPTSRSWGSAALGRGSRNSGVVAARASQAFAALTIATAVLWFPAPTASCMEGGSRIKNIARKRSLSGLPLCGRCCLSFLIRTPGLRPCISTGSRSNSK